MCSSDASAHLLGASRARDRVGQEREGRGVALCRRGQLFKLAPQSQIPRSDELDKTGCSWLRMIGRNVLEVTGLFMFGTPLTSPFFV